MKKFYIGAAVVSIAMFLLWFTNKNEVKTLEPPAALVIKNKTDPASPDKNTVITIDVPKQKQALLCSPAAKGNETGKLENCRECISSEG